MSHFTPILMNWYKFDFVTKLELNPYHDIKQRFKFLKHLEQMKNLKWFSNTFNISYILVMNFKDVKDGISIEFKTLGSKRNEEHEVEVDNWLKLNGFYFVNEVELKFSEWLVEKKETMMFWLSRLKKLKLIEKPKIKEVPFKAFKIEKYL